MHLSTVPSVSASTAPCRRTTMPSRITTSTPPPCASAVPSPARARTPASRSRWSSSRGSMRSRPEIRCRQTSASEPALLLHTDARGKSRRRLPACRPLLKQRRPLRCTASFSPHLVHALVVRGRRQRAPRLPVRGLRSTICRLELGRTAVDAAHRWDQPRVRLEVCDGGGFTSSHGVWRVDGQVTTLEAGST